MLSPLANRGTITRAERDAEEIVGQCRRALGDLLNADPDGGDLRTQHDRGDLRSVPHPVGDMALW